MVIKNGWTRDCFNTGKREREKERERLHLIHYSHRDLALLYSSLIYNFFLVLAASCNAHILGGNPR